MKLTYYHTTLDGKVFYVGAGNEKRPYAKTGRSDNWRAASSKGYTVEIAAQWDTAKEAGEHEKFLIACFINIGHPLINKQRGGGGTLGWTASEDVIAKNRAAHLGNKNPMHGKSPTAETIAKLRLAKLGEKNHMHGRTGDKNPMHDKQHTEEARTKMRHVWALRKASSAMLKGETP